jgi:Lysyl oxidase
VRRSQQLAALTRPRVLVLALALAALVAGLLSLAVPAARSADARPATAAGTPKLKLIAAQKTIEVGKYGKGAVYFDPGIWVASLGGPFQLNVKRASYTKPLTIRQVIKNSAGVTTRERLLPGRLIKDQWNGLTHFMKVTIRHKGKVVGNVSVTFCPDEDSLSRATPDSPTTDGYPEQCSASGFFGFGGQDAFSLGEVWGITRGWAADPTTFEISHKLAYGTYKVTESINPVYRRLFDVSRSDSVATITMKVVKAQQCCNPINCCDTAKAPAHFVLARTRQRGEASRATQTRLPSLPATRTLRKPPLDALPDLIPLPSWGISVQNQKKPRESYLDFGATVWIGGHARLDVEGFRSNGSDRMKAYQYFWLHGHLIGKMRVGTMGFSGYNSWHFQQFAQYKLLNAKKKVVVRSRKIGFCIAPTDGIDMLLRGATWVPSYTGIAGNCGSQTALWVQELLPLGWGDTYFQTVPYQSFEISKIPNGTYYIEIIANPEHLLHEVSTANDVSFRRVIIGGTPGHRTVRVPAYDGLDPER